MTEIRSEAVEAADKSFQYILRQFGSGIPVHRRALEAAISAFCEAEGLTVEYQCILARAPITGEPMAVGTCSADKAERQRLLGRWREVEE